MQTPTENVKVEARIVRQFRRMAKQEGMKLQSLLSKALADWLAKRAGREQGT